MNKACSHICCLFFLMFSHNCLDSAVIQGEEKQSRKSRREEWSNKEDQDQDWNASRNDWKWLWIRGAIVITFTWKIKFIKYFLHQLAVHAWQKPHPSAPQFEPPWPPVTQNILIPTLISHFAIFLKSHKPQNKPQPPTKSLKTSPLLQNSVKFVVEILCYQTSSVKVREGSETAMKNSVTFINPQAHACSFNIILLSAFTKSDLARNLISFDSVAYATLSFPSFWQV